MRTAPLSCSDLQVANHDWQEGYRLQITATHRKSDLDFEWYLPATHCNSVADHGQIETLVFCKSGMICKALQNI